jgi:hypothetical protein
MAPDEAAKSAKVSKEDFDVISNRIAVALAKREALIKSWTASSSRERPLEKTEAELEAEDAALFRNEPPYLGVGAPIPSHFLVSEAERSNKSLRAKLLPSKTLKASKARDAEEKAASAKRGLKDESSDEEQGRSGLGRAKKRKTQMKIEPVEEAGTDENSKLPKAQATSANLVAKAGKDATANTFAQKSLLSSKKVEAHEGDKGTPNIPTSVDHDIKAGKDVGLSKLEKKNLLELPMSREKSNTEEEDAASAKVVATKNVESKPIPVILQKNGVMDPEERKRMKKREKRKRKKEKLKAAGKAWLM